MSDPAYDQPYECHGPMRALQLADLTVCAFVCDACGIARHALPRSDPRREQAETLIATVLEANRAGAFADLE